MKERLLELKDYLLKRRVDYGDIRYEARSQQAVEVRNDEVEKVTERLEAGVGIRVIVKGAWGFAAASTLTPEALCKTADLAIEVAEASARTTRKKVELAPLSPCQGTYRSPCEKDPFSVPLTEKISLLLGVTDILKRDDRIRVARANVRCSKRQKWFISTEGAEIYQEIISTAGGFEATAVSGNDAQKRSYPAGHGGDCATRGYEFIEEMDFLGHAESIRLELLALLDAPECPSTHTDLILMGNQMSLQIHESCGHPIELDRVLGTELSLAGGSFLSIDKLGTFRYGSSIVNITADASLPGGMGSFGFDDEGVPAQRYDVVREGIFTGYLSSRETAPTIDKTSSGAMRASGWNQIPLIRMTNINLQAGEGSLADLIADTKQGILMDSNKVWSIDDMRVNFQFGCEIAWEIENGKLGRIIKNPSYTGITPEFWGSCDAVCGPEEWRVWGVGNCGKGEPMQTIGTGHGASPTRFRHVRVGVKK